MLLVPLLAFLEACIGIGLFVSGALLLIVSAALYSTGNASLGFIVPLALVGALAGDHVGFYFGRMIGPDFHHSQFAQKYDVQVKRADAMIGRFGGLAIFIGRFVPAIRSVVPTVIGISGFRPKRFSILDGIACLSWSLALGGLVLLIDLAV